MDGLMRLCYETNPMIDTTLCNSERATCICVYMIYIYVYVCRKRETDHWNKQMQTS